MGKKPVVEAREVTMQEALEAGLSEEQIASYESPQKAFEHYLGTPVFDKDGKVSCAIKASGPNAEEAERLEVEVATGMSETPVPLKPMTEYDKALALVEEYEEMTQTRGWKRYYDQVRLVRKIADENLHGPNALQKNFPVWHARYNVPQFLLGDKQQPNEDGTPRFFKDSLLGAMNALNNIQRSGEMPIFTDGKTASRASFNEETGIVSIIKGETLSPEVAEIIAEVAPDEGESGVEENEE